MEASRRHRFFTPASRSGAGSDDTTSLTSFARHVVKRVRARVQNYTSDVRPSAERFVIVTNVPVWPGW